MLEIGSSEFLLIAIVAVIAIGPRDLPRALHALGKVTGQGKAMMQRYKFGLEAMAREAELAELEKHWTQVADDIVQAHDAPLLPAQFEGGFELSRLSPEKTSLGCAGNDQAICAVSDLKAAGA